jgi:hypothetical protein
MTAADVGIETSRFTRLHEVNAEYRVIFRVPFREIFPSLKF